MPFNNSLRLFAFSGFCVITSACGLLPDLGSDKMSNSEKAELNLQMGVRYLEMDMLDVAKEKLEIAYDLDSGNPEILNALAVFHERLKNDGEAEDFYRSAIDKAPDNYSIKNNYGRFLCERHKYDQGQAMLQEALDSPFNKRSWLALTNIGICRLQQNEDSAAEEYFRLALQASSEYAPALLEMMKISYRKQQYMSARAFLQRYSAVVKSTPEPLWFGFQIERALGNRQGAESYKEQLITNFPTSKEADQVKSAINK